MSMPFDGGERDGARGRNGDIALQDGQEFDESFLIAAANLGRSSAPELPTFAATPRTAAVSQWRDGAARSTL